MTPYETVRVADLAWCAPLAVVSAFVIAASRRLGFVVAARVTSRPVVGMVVAGLLVGLLALGFREATDRPVDLVLFSGQSALPAIAGESTGWVLLRVVVAKGLAYSLSLGAGFRGGPTFPAIAIGTALYVAAADLLPGLETTPAIVTGIAAGTAVVLNAPFTAALLASLLVGSSAADTAPFAVIAAVLGMLVAQAIPDPGAKEDAAPTDPGGAAPAPT